MKRLIGSIFYKLAQYLQQFSWKCRNVGWALHYAKYKEEEWKLNNEVRVKLNNYLKRLRKLEPRRPNVKRFIKELEKTEKRYNDIWLKLERMPYLKPDGTEINVDKAQ